MFFRSRLPTPTRKRQTISASPRRTSWGVMRFGRGSVSSRPPIASCLLVAGLAITMCACSKAVPEVIESTQAVDPTGRLVATVELVHNGLGFGAGALYDEVHVSAVSHRPFAHGDGDGSVAFYSDSTYGYG